MSVSAFIFMVINFVILIGALIFFAGKSVKAKFSGRVLKIHDELDSSRVASIKAQELLASVSQIDSLAAERRNEIFADANEMMARNSEESAQKSLEEKEGILQDAEDVRELMAAGMHGRIYLEAIDKLADSARALLMDDKFADARRQLQENFISDVEPVLKPTRSDLVKMDECDSVDVVVSGSEEISMEYMGRLHDMIADKFIDCQYETDPELGTEIQIQFGDKVYRGTLESIMDDMDRDSFDVKNSSPFSSRPIDLALIGENIKSSDIKELKKIISDNFINYDFEIEPSQPEEVELQFGDKVYKGTFDNVIEQIGMDMA